MVVLIIDKFNVEHVGKYTCKSQNNIGQDLKELSITIKLAPIVEVVPHFLNLIEGATGSLKCNIKNVEAGHKITWQDNSALMEGIHVNFLISLRWINNY